MLKDGEDDIITTEIRLPVNRKVKVKIVAMDVLHNFYLPNFDVKMDAVPGMPTQFVFTPITTTVEMREILKDNPVWSQLDDDPDEPQPRYKSFNYEVACAELCGRGHSSMQATLVIGTDEEYEAWLATQPLYYETVKETLLKEANAASAFNQN